MKTETKPNRRRSAETVGAVHDFNVWAERLQTWGGQLSTREKEIITYITANPHKAAFFKQNELALAVGVSKPLVISCYRKLGYAEFKEFQQGVQAFYASQINSYQASTAAFRDITTIDSLLTTALEVDIQALQSARKTIDEQQVREAAEALVSARRIFVLSEGTGFYPAHYLHQRLLRNGLTSILAGSDREHVLDSISGIGKDDLLLTFFYTQDQTFIRKVFSYSDKRGGTNLLITGKLDAELVSASAQTIFVPRGQINFKNSMAVPMWFANVLLLAVELLSGNPLQEHLRSLEAARKDMES